jgi:hypothetical protein
MDQLSRDDEASKKSDVIDPGKMEKVSKSLSKWEPDQKKYEDQFKQLLSEIEVIRSLSLPSV